MGRVRAGHKNIGDAITQLGEVRGFFDCNNVIDILYLLLNSYA